MDVLKVPIDERLPAFLGNLHDGLVGVSECFHRRADSASFDEVQVERRMNIRGLVNAGVTPMMLWIASSLSDIWLLTVHHAFVQK